MRGYDGRTRPNIWVADALTLTLQAHKLDQSLKISDVFMLIVVSDGIVAGIVVVAGHGIVVGSAVII